jgi:hypothetical protein
VQLALRARHPAASRAVFVQLAAWRSPLLRLARAFVAAGPVQLAGGAWGSCSSVV